LSHMLYSVRSSVVLLALIATLAMSPVAPEAGNVIFLALGGLSAALMFARAREQLRRPIVWMPLLGLALIAVAYVIGAKSFEGLIGLAFFSPLFVIWPLLTAAEEMKSDNSSGLIAMLALAGVAGAAVIAVLEVVATGTVRAGGGVANPIHFADVALLVGFLACAGLVGKFARWRFLFLLGPVFATIAVVLSGTRGAVVAIAAMLFVAAMGLVVLRLISVKKALIALVVLVVGGAVALLLGASQLSGIQRVLIDMAEVLQNGVPTDESTAIRLQMISGGIKAFLQAPIFGHGPLGFANLANELSDLPPGTWPHLHNDLADFAASAGIAGLVAYALFLLAPIVEVVRSPSSAAKPAILVLVSTLVVGFFVMGLTNAMFGILTVTVSYAVICVVIGILVAQAPPAPKA
jgi:O-antigen ligase